MGIIDGQYFGADFKIAEIEVADDAAIAKIVRANLKAKGLDIPGTAYFDTNLDHLSDYYLNDERRYYGILKKDGRVVGGGGMAEMDDIENCAELQKLYLDDSVKGRGLGRGLVAFIMDKAREKGYKHIYLETHTNLDIAIKLYRKMGFKEIPRPDFVVHSTMDTFMIADL